MPKPNQTNTRALEEIRKSGTAKVKVAATDIDGVLRGKYLHADKFFSAADGGFGFCNVVFGWDAGDVCYDNVQYTGWHTGYPDAKAQIDLSTFRRIPWDQHTPFFLADFVDDNGKALDVCPRQLLKRIIGRAEQMGFAAKVGLEFEWFNFRETPQSLEKKGYVSPEPITPGMFGYSILRSSLNQPYFAALMDELRLFGVPIEGLHTETGPGVYEAAIRFSDALEAADRAVLFKSGVKEIAYRFGILPCFMAKWNAKLPGCSGHIHQSLFNPSGERNLFFNAKAKHQMSETFAHFLAGQLHCLPELLPFFAPTVNSYKRLVEGLWAPTKSNWGVENRTTAFRVIPSGEKSTRLETRISGADINPYLGVAAALASGLYGVERKLKLEQKPVEGNAYHDRNGVPLAQNLLASTEKLSKSKIAKEMLGESFVEHFVNTRIWEWRRFQDAVTDWELQRYLEII